MKPWKEWVIKWHRHLLTVNKNPSRLSSSGPPNNSSVHGGSKHSENSHCRDLRGQLRSICCSSHGHYRHTTKECGRRRRLRRLRGLHTSGLSRRCYPGAHPRRLPDVLILVRRVETDHELPLKEHFTIYEERTCGISTPMKPESEECYQMSY